MTITYNYNVCICWAVHNTSNLRIRLEITVTHCLFHIDFSMEQRVIQPPPRTQLYEDRQYQKESSTI